MSSVNDVSGIPTAGKRQIIVAVVDQVLHFRIFDGDGKMVVDTDAKRLTEQARPIEDLKKQLESLWPPHELTESEKVRVIAAVTSIVGHTLLDPKEGDWQGILVEPCEWLNERLSGHPQMIRIAVPIAREGPAALKAHLDALSGDLQTQLDAMVKTGMDRAGKQGRRLVAFLTFFPAGRFTREELEEVCALPSGEGGVDAESATSDRADDLSWLDTGLQRLTEGGLLDFSQEESIYTFHETLLDYARRVAPLDQERASRTLDRLLRFYLKYIRRNHGNNRAIDRCIDNAHVLMGKIWGEAFDWESPRYRRRITRLISLAGILWEYHLERGRWRRAVIWHERFLDQLFPTAPERTVKAARRGGELLRYAALLSKQGKLALGRKRFDACIELEEKRGISVVLAYALMGKATLEQAVGHLEPAEQLERRALEILRLLKKEGFEP